MHPASLARRRLISVMRRGAGSGGRCRAQDIRPRSGGPSREGPAARQAVIEPARKRYWLAAVGKNGLPTGVGAEQT